MLSLILISGLLTACAQQAATQWTNNAQPQASFPRDSYECEKDTRQSGYFGTGLVGAVSMQNFYVTCLGARGWSQTSLPIARRFTAEEWDTGRKACKEDASGYSSRSGVPFSTAFDDCMKGRGL